MKDIALFIRSTDLTSLSKDQIDKIKARLPEYYRASSIIGHSTSQASYSLQTMNMIDDSPLSRMKQCIAQINRKYGALQEAYFSIEKRKIEIKKLLGNTDELSRLEAREKEASISTTSVGMGNTLRQIGMFQDMYESIRKNNNISEEWTEKDYEIQEIHNMIRKSFRLGIQDMQAYGRVSKASVEYWEQLGIHPQMADTIIKGYLISIQKRIEDHQEVTITDMHKFLDKMVEQFKDAYKLALKRIGLDEIGSEEFMANGMTKPQT